jgi:hypothetical protein
MAFLDTLNGNNLLTAYKLIIQTGTHELLEYPERKESLSNDWREEDGTETDLELVRFKDKEVNLNCIFIVNDDTEYWNCYNAFFEEITKPGLQSLFIEDHAKTYQVFYKKTSGFKKVSKRLKNVPKVAVKFTLILEVKS